MSLFFKAPLDIEVRLSGEDTRKHVEVKNKNGRKEKLPLYEDGESVKGQVTIRVKDGRRVEHLGIKIQLIGTIDTNNEGLNFDNFLYLVKELSASRTEGRR